MVLSCNLSYAVWALYAYRVEDEAELEKFAGRAADLQAVVRYHIYPVMMYRTNLLIHSRRVAWIMDELAPVAKRVFGRYDARRARMMTLVHDDAEIVMGDVQAGNKGNMTKAQLAEVDEMEARAIDVITARFPKTVAGYNYRELQEEAAAHDTVESQVLQFADKFDAIGEALHEVFAGNTVFVTHITNQFGKIPTPVQYYLAWFKRYPDKFPQMKPLLESGEPMLQPMPDLDYTLVAHQGRRHTPGSFRSSSGYRPYDLWKQVTLKYAGTKELKLALEPAEHLPNIVRHE